MNVHTMIHSESKTIEKSIRAVVKYQDRGYTFVEGVDEDPTHNPLYPDAFRSWNDGHTLRMRFHSKRRVLSERDGAMKWTLNMREHFPPDRYLDKGTVVQVREEKGKKEVRYRNAGEKRGWVMRMG